MDRIFRPIAYPGPGADMLSEAKESRARHQG